MKNSCIASRGSDPTELATALLAFSSRATIRAENGSEIRFDFEIANAGAVTIGRCRYDGNLTVVQERRGGSYLLHFHKVGQSSFEQYGRQIVLSPRKGAIINGSNQSTNVISGCSEQLVVAIDRKVIQARLTNKLETIACNDLEFTPEIDLSSGPGIAVAHVARTFYIGLIRKNVLRQAPVACSMLTNALVELMLESLPHNYSDALKSAAGPQPRHVKHAIEFMRKNLLRPLTLEDIAFAVGVRTRTLQEGFRRFKSTTPMTYFQYLRLDAAHKELIQNPHSKSVGEIARKWGFTHRGRFAADYRKRFGQFPSQALAGEKF